MRRLLIVLLLLFVRMSLSFGLVYKVLRINTTHASTEQLRLLAQLHSQAHDLNLDFWKEPRPGSAFVDVMVTNQTMPTLIRLVDKVGLAHQTTVDDVEKLIITREQQTSKNDQRRLGDHFGQTSDHYSFLKYGSYEDMQKWMRSLARRYATFVRYITIGQSHEKRSIDGLEIGSGQKEKRVFWIDGGIHAREWASIHTALFFIHQLTSKFGRDDNVTMYIDSLTWVIVPCLNPDGYEYTRSQTHPNVRLWRKNRSPTKCAKDAWGGKERCCHGVDLNRNFAFHFRESGSSDDPCSEIYQGEVAFDQPESRAVRDAVLSKRYRNRIDGYITLHTYSQIWIHPFGHRKDTYPGDIKDLFDVGKKAAKALKTVHGTEYLVGSGADTLYPASGGSEDWAKEQAQIKFVYLLELRPDEKTWDGFILDEQQLVPTAEETWIGVLVVADAMRALVHSVNSSSQSSAAQLQQSPSFGDGSPGSCFDLRHACKRWVREDESLCDQVKGFMRDNCAYSCSLC